MKGNTRAEILIRQLQKTTIKYNENRIENYVVIQRNMCAEMSDQTAANNDLLNCS